MHLDTHVVVWLYINMDDAFSRMARHLVDTEPLAVSPMVAMELDLLHEVGRTAGPADVVLAGLQHTLGLAVSSMPFAAVVGASPGPAIPSTG